MRELREHLSLARNAVGHDAIERGNTVCRDQQEGVAKVKDFADLAALEFLDAGQVELQQRCGRHVSKDEARGLKFKVQSSTPALEFCWCHIEFDHVPEILSY